MRGTASRRRRKEIAMKAAVIFTGTGPTLVLTSLASLDDPAFAAGFAAKGVTKFFACEVPLDEVRSWYGPRFDSVLEDADQDDELRILDIDGQHIFCHLRLASLGPVVRFEPKPAAAGA
jgi:hypothetical protein